MPKLLRPFLIRLLLLAVFFNTVVGLPSHEAEHFARAQVSDTSAALSVAAQDADAPEEGTEAHGACAWCLAHAHLGIGLAPSPWLAAWLQPSGQPCPQASETFVDSTGRWPFASRDPPRLA